MSKPKPRFSIVGLGLIGSSIGLALRQVGVASIIVGHDKEPNVAAQAKKRGAVDRTDWNLVSACEESDLVMLALPISEIEPTLKAIGPYLRAGCVVMDTAPLKQTVLVWAAETLPEQVHFVGGDPIIGSVVGGKGGVDAARADLFQNELFCLTPSANADPAAVKLATDLVTSLGARPLFLDPAEHDGLLAAVDQLPTVLALALMDTLAQQPVWRELRKVAGASFEVGTRLASTDPAAAAALCLSSQDNLLRWIDTFVDRLTSLRRSLAEEDGEWVLQTFTDALREREEWLRDRAAGVWETRPEVEIPKSNVFANAFLGSWGRKRPRKED